MEFDVVVYGSNGDGLMAGHLGAQAEVERHGSAVTIDLHVYIAIGEYGRFNVVEGKPIQPLQFLEGSPIAAASLHTAGCKRRIVTVERRYKRVNRLLGRREIGFGCVLTCGATHQDTQREAETSRFHASVPCFPGGGGYRVPRPRRQRHLKSASRASEGSDTRQAHASSLCISDPSTHGRNVPACRV